MIKHTKLFNRAIARIRALNIKNGAVLVQRIKTVYKTGFQRAAKLKFELEEAGAIRAKVGNIIWENMSKFKIPREITKQESSRVKQESKTGKIPMFYS